MAMLRRVCGDWGWDVASDDAVVDAPNTDDEGDRHNVEDEGARPSLDQRDDEERDTKLMVIQIL